jgi:hypothetical protein
VFIAPGGVELFGAWAGAVAALIGVYRVVVRGAARGAPEHLTDARAGRWLAPVTALSACVFGVLPAAPGVGEQASVFGYFLYDLRWWWAAVTVLWVALRADRLMGSPVARRLLEAARWSRRARLLLFDAALLIVVMSFAAATSRHLRFDPGLHGDEPKYIRYLEAWYQGGGFEVSSHRRFRDMPLDAPSQVLRNVSVFGRSIAEESRALAGDLRGFFADPWAFQWNRARRGEGFVTGKRGGLYQIYLPGVSFLLFPGYFVDRHVLALRPTDHGEFPAELVMTYLTMLLLYGLCAVALFRLLRRALSSEILAFFWATVAMLSMPATGFAFQFYPETPALLAILLVTTYIWFHAQQTGWVKAAAAGAAAGGLAWFHPRFLLVSAVLTVAGAVKTTPRGARAAFLVTAGLGYLSVMAFAYRVTGSWMPTALWDAPGAETTLNLKAPPLTLFGYALHRTWGAAPHTPLFLGAVPGLAVLARQSPGLAVFVLVTGLALAFPAAAHTLTAAGGTPGRLIVAIVPLFILPVAVLVRRFWSTSAVRMATIVALVVSLETGVSYNWHHIKMMGWMHSAGASGWRLNLAFPWVSGGGWADSAANVALFLVILVLLAVATVLAFVRAAPANPPARRAAHRWMPGASFVLIVLLCGAATAVNRSWVHWEYQLADDAARRAAAEALVDHDQCKVCFATRDRAIDWRWLDPNGAERVNLETSVIGQTATIHIFLDGESAGLCFGRIRAEFGDGAATAWTGIVGSRELVHTYKRPGEYAVVVWLQLRNGEMRADRRTVSIQASP